MRGLERQEFQLKGGGTLLLREEGALVQLQVTRPDDKRGLYKVWIRGPGGRLLLGTLIPEGSSLYLRRRLSRCELERSGCWPIAGGETVLAFSFERGTWNREEHPERLVRDAVLRQTLRGRHMFLRRGEGGFCLAASFDTAQPFPITPLFCLAKMDRTEHGNQVVFWFDREGNPILPHNRRDDGENSGTS